ncbi:ABC transporter permease [Nocardioides sp. Root151]|uniref:ABC transporter permease n=1 Tax=Nocardioides sp. Root151 TaxID=1736475 RepID=UPI00070384E8|nr:ABC transporter permease [Nocardioides sp. Root151]KQZ70787.1 ABC transporter permease [Nocardioides sp. Root151]
MTLTATDHRRVEATTDRAGFGAALAFEVRKLRAQVRVRAVLAGALLAPVPIALIIHAQGNPPKDTLFGRFATTNGFALTLLVLGFAGQWLLPLLTAVVAGDIFASEDHHGTWKTIMTRSVSRASLFGAKTTTALGFAALGLGVLAASTIVSSVLIGGHGTLTGLSGQLVPPATAWRLVSASWLSTLPPSVAFTALAILLSVWSRSVAVGVAAPTVIGMVMQLVGATGGAEALRPYLPTTAYEAWHGFLATPAFTGPFLIGLVACSVWTVLTLGLALAITVRRDITGG